MAARRLLLRSARRLYSAASTNAETQAAFSNANSAMPVAQGWLFIDSVFPIQLGRWDLRHYIGMLRSPALLGQLEERLNKLKTHNFHVLSIEPQPKDGGVFVKFSYTPLGDETPETLERVFRGHVAAEGPLPSWLGLSRGNLWLVRGTPWREDLNRFPSPVLKVTFEGPDIHEQKLYQLCRPFGRLNELNPPTPVPAGTPRSAVLTFSRIHSAAIARNVIHGLNVDSSTTIRLNYQQPIQAHAVRDWMSAHPKIMLPLIVFLLGTLTYTIFDPIRSFMVQGKLEDWFDYQKNRVYQWLRKTALNSLSFTASSSSSSTSPIVENGWKERQHAESSIRAYLTDMPNTVAFVHGPQGSGKSRLVNVILDDIGANSPAGPRTTLTIDCRELLKSATDSQVVSDLAKQTGYWPVFTFLNSLNSLIDLASVGLIGQKTGMSSSVPDQVQQILAVVGTALRRVYSSHRRNAQKRFLHEEQERRAAEELEKRRARIRDGSWHDGRLDVIAGNGVMSELGVGDEMWDADDVKVDSVHVDSEKDSEHTGIEAARLKSEEEKRKKKTEADIEAVSALPVVVIRNFDAKTVGGMGLAANANTREQVLNVLANWAGTLVENQIAHVIVISDNRENAKRLAQALALKPLNSIALFDADPASSLAFVKQKLSDADVKVSFTSEEIHHLERLGGRASDLESLIHKVRNGQTIEGAVEDIIIRGVGELRKSAFGDDMEDAKGRAWTREQAWRVIKELSNKAEIAYYDILIDFPFKGDDTGLRGMENAELIAIGTHEGRPTTIRPGKPVFRWVFERLVKDRVFSATQELAYNEKVLSASESKVLQFEEELQRLKELEPMQGGGWWLVGGRRRTISERKRLIMRKLWETNRKIEEVERKNERLRSIIKEGQ